MSDISVKAQKVLHKDLPLYLFGLTAGDLLAISYILPRSRDDPDAIERALDPGRVDEISKFIVKPNSYLPGAILLTINSSKEGIISWTEDDSTALFKIERPKMMHDEIRRQVLAEIPGLDEDSEEMAIEIERRLSKVATIIDGQHRLKGLQKAGQLEIVLPVIALKDADPKKAAKIFADINGEQRPVSANSILMIRYEIGAIEDALEAQATQIARELNDRIDSPFKGKVRVYEEDTKTWIPAKTLKEALYPIIGVGALQGMSADQQTTCFVSFFQALKQQNSAAFDDKTRRDYILTQPRGIQSALGVFERVWRRCEVYEHGDFSPAAILRQIAPLQVMNWSKAKYGQLKGAGGPILLRTKMLHLLPERDERKSPEYDKVVHWFQAKDLVLSD